MGNQEGQIRRVEGISDMLEMTKANSILDLGAADALVMALYAKTYNKIHH